MLAIAAALFLQAATPQVIETRPATEQKPATQRMKVICREELRPNSRFGRRVCRTPENLAKLQERTDEEVRQTFNRSGIPVGTK